MSAPLNPPTAFSRLIPVLVYRDIAAAHDFLVEAFGFAPGGVHRDAEGNAVHGEVHIGTTPLWLHRAVPDDRLLPPNVADAATSGLVIHVDRLDAHHERAKGAGARIDSEPADQPYGQREYAARDPEGHRWWFASSSTAAVA